MILEVLKNPLLSKKSFFKHLSLTFLTIKVLGNLVQVLGNLVQVLMLVDLYHESCFHLF